MDFLNTHFLSDAFNFHEGHYEINDTSSELLHSDHLSGDMAHDGIYDFDNHSTDIGHSDLFHTNELSEQHNDIMHSGLDDFSGSSPSDFDSWYLNVHGTPIEDSLVWHEQTTDFTCGIVSPEMVIKMFGLDVSEAQLVFEATSAGYLTDHGMSIDGIQFVLNNHGIPTHTGSGGIEDLVSELDKGHKIIVPVDSGEIWGTDSPFEDLLNQNADHAVVVTGIDFHSSTPTVILNDPGHPDGQAMQVDLDKFVDAWKDSGYNYISTDNTPI